MKKLIDALDDGTGWAGHGSPYLADMLYWGTFDTLAKTVTPNVGPITSVDGSAATFVPAKWGNGIFFDKFVDSHIVIPDMNANTYDHLTVDFWYKRTGDAVGMLAFVVLGEADNTPEPQGKTIMRFQSAGPTDTDPILVWLYDSTWAYNQYWTFDTLATLFPFDTEGFYTIVFDSSQAAGIDRVKLYYNAVEVTAGKTFVDGAGAYPAIMSNTIRAIRVNGSPLSGLFEMAGWIDNLRIWNTIKTPAEITALMAVEIIENAVIPSVFRLNEVPDYIAGYNTKSIMFEFPGVSGSYIEKVFPTPIDITGYAEIVFHLWSRNQRGLGEEYLDTSVYAYKIEFGNGVEYFVPTFNEFTDLTIDVYGMTEVSKIKITALTDVGDYLIVSYMLAVKDEYPLDIFEGVKEMLEAKMLAMYGWMRDGTSGKGVKIGTITGTTGDRSFILTVPPTFAERYTVLLIDDGTNTERHQLDHTDNTEFVFNCMYDGETLLHDYVDAAVYLIIPVEFGMSEKDIILPGIAIWGMNPEETIASNNVGEARDTFKVNEDEVAVRRPTVRFRYTLLIDCEARHNQMVAVMSEVVRTALAFEMVWVGGKKTRIFSGGASTFMEPTEAFAELPKIQYNAIVEVREEIERRTYQVGTNTNNRVYTLI